MDSGNSAAEFEERLSQVLARTEPGYLRIESIERLSAGASLETYRVVAAFADGPRRLAFRRAINGAPKASISWAPSIEAEAQLMIAARNAAIPSPDVHTVLREEDGLGHGFVMEWLDGETLGPRIVRSERFAGVRPGLAYQCGVILGRIHSIDVRKSGLEPHLRRFSTAELVDYAIGWYRKFGVARPTLEYAARWLRDHLPAPSTLTLVHNDFRNGNLIVSEQGIIGVLDWEHSLIGDPLRDLGWLCTRSWRFGRCDLPVGGFGHYEDLFAGYASVTGRRVTVEQVRYWEVLGALWWSAGCLQLAAQYHEGLDRGIERLVIGRRVSECEANCIELLLPGSVDRPEGDQSVRMDTRDTVELLDGVRAFLKEEIESVRSDRSGYLARVAGNALEIVRRDHLYGPRARAAEAGRLVALLGQNGSLEDLRRELVARLRDGRQQLDDPVLENHLRSTTAAQIAIDQPKYWNPPATS